MRETTAGGRIFVPAVTGLAGLVTLVAGGWALVDAASFAAAIDFPPFNAHLVHDLGAFQLGIGLTLLLALCWGDPLAVVLAGFLAGTAAHAVNHLVDADLGGRGLDTAALAVLALLVAAALAVRLRQLGYVLGRVAGASVPALAPFVRQKTVALTSFRADGRPVPSPVSIAVDGDRAYVRTWHTAAKARRLRRDPRVLIGACTGLGRPTGGQIRATAQLLSGAEERHAAALLAAKYPLLQGLLVPRAHRLRRVRTLHYAITPGEPEAPGNID